MGRRDLSVEEQPDFLALLKRELRAHMALVTRSEEPRAKSSYVMSSSRILRINRLLSKESQRLNAGRDLK